MIAFEKIYGCQDLRPLVKPSLTLIQAQADLIKTSKIAKEWVNQNRCMMRKPGCTHCVLPLYHIQDETFPRAYFKRGRDQGIIEKIIWDIAGILGWEDLFAATKMETVYLEKVHYLVGQSIRREEVNRIERGSMQTAIPGTLLHDWNGHPSLDMVCLCRAFAAMFILGLNDLHAKNIMVREDGSLKFFDNGKCLPPGNHYIVSGESLFPIHRFSPLNFPEGKLPLDESQRQAMKSMVRSCRNSWTALENFFSSAIMKRRGLKLPRYWLNSKASLRAMAERVEILDRALDSANGKSLQDLMIDVYPEYKFSFILSMIYAMDHGHPIPKSVDEAIGFYHGAVGGISLFETISHLFAKKFDLIAIYEMTHHPAVTFRQAIAYSLLRHPDFLLKDQTEPEAVLEFEQIKKWLIETFSDIPRDHKNALERYPEYRPLKDLLPILAKDFLLYRADQANSPFN